MSFEQILPEGPPGLSGKHAGTEQNRSCPSPPLTMHMTYAEYQWALVQNRVAQYYSNRETPHPELYGKTPINVYRNAVDEAEREIRMIDKDIDNLVDRRERFERVIIAAKELEEEKARRG